MKQKKIPMRKCVECGERLPKKDLIRIVNSKDEGIRLDPSGKANGRGAYVCKSQSCIEDIKESSKLANALKSQIDDSVFEEIEAYVKD